MDEQDEEQEFGRSPLDGDNQDQDQNAPDERLGRAAGAADRARIRATCNSASRSCATAWNNCNSA